MFGLRCDTEGGLEVQADVNAIGLRCGWASELQGFALRRRWIFARRTRFTWRQNARAADLHHQEAKRRSPLASVVRNDDR